MKAGAMHAGAGTGTARETDSTQKVNSMTDSYESLGSVSAEASKVVVEPVR
jgi:hypothetical protein